MTRDPEVLLTTVRFIGVIATVIHPITLPHQADAHAVLALEAELVTGPVEFRVLGCRGGMEGHQRFGVKFKGLRKAYRAGRKEHTQRQSRTYKQSITVQSQLLGDLAAFWYPR